MSTQRDELAREIHSTEQLGCGCCTDYNYTREQDQHADKLDVNPIAVAIGDTLLAAGWTKPRTITTVEELERLPHKTVLLDSDSEAVQRIDDETMDDRSLWETALGLVTSSLVMLPATVLYEPTA